MANQGTFIVIEGSDGSGKGTQFRLLKERLRAVGYEIAEFDFPRYDKSSSHFVRAYLNGEYGPAEKVSPYTASLFYALDRFEAAKDIKSALEQGKVVLANRYVGSNMAHQGAKIIDPIEQRSFFVWEDSLEFQMLGLPRPNLNIYLRVPANVSFELIKKKSARTYTDKSHDEHEANIRHLERAVDTYDLLCRLFPRDFRAIDCVKDGRMLGITDINNLIWESISSELPPKPEGKGRSVTLRLDDQPKKTATKASPKKQATPTKSLKRQKITVGQLLEIDRTHPSTAHYRLSWEKNEYDYMVPNNLPKNLRKKYEESMEKLGDLTKAMRDKLGKNADKDALLAAVLPLGALISAEIDSKIDVPAAAKAAKAKPNGIQKLAKDFLPDMMDTHIEPVALLEYVPRNEFKLLADGLYSFSNMSREQLGGEIEKWDYKRKSTALEELLAADGSEAAKLVKYRFDLVADQLTINKLSSSGFSAGSMHIQPASPRYGYDVPKHIEDLGIDDEYIRCFDTSLDLFSSLQAAGQEEMAHVAVLLGHKVRFQLECSLEELRSALKSKDENVKTLVTGMIEKIGEVHPLIKAHIDKPTANRSNKSKKS